MSRLKSKRSAVLYGTKLIALASATCASESQFFLCSAFPTACSVLVLYWYISAMHCRPSQYEFSIHENFLLVCSPTEVRMVTLRRPTCIRKKRCSNDDRQVEMLLSTYPTLLCVGKLLIYYASNEVSGLPNATRELRLAQVHFTDMWSKTTLRPGKIFCFQNSSFRARSLPIMSKLVGRARSCLWQSLYTASNIATTTFPVPSTIVFHWRWYRQMQKTSRPHVEACFLFTAT